MTTTSTFLFSFPLHYLLLFVEILIRPIDLKGIHNSATSVGGSGIPKVDGAILGVLVNNRTTLALDNKHRKVLGSATCELQSSVTGVVRR